MSTLTIRKKSLKTWLHTDSILGDFIISKFYFNADNGNFQVVEQGQSKRVIYDVSDITLYNDTDGGSAETFANITALSLRLEELNYPAFQYDGQIVSIANLIDAGTNVTITGDGTEASPYVISATGGGGGGAVDSVNGQTGVVSIDLESVLTEGNEANTLPIKVSDVQVYNAPDDNYLKISASERAIMFDDLAVPPSSFTIATEALTSSKTYGLPNENGYWNVIQAGVANFTAQLFCLYIAKNTITITDPTPVTNAGYQVHVIGGSVTIGGVAYTSGALVYRYYDGSVWISTNMNTTIDATPTDGSSNAVSSNGVFDALALKTGRLITDVTTSTAHTGTLTNTIVKSYLIPANTFLSSDAFSIHIKQYKTGTNGNLNTRIYTNTSVAIPANPIALNSTTATLIYSGFERTFKINGGNLFFPNTGNVTASSDNVTSSVATEQSVSFNVAVDNYIIIAIQLSNSADSVTINQVLARQ